MVTPRSRIHRLRRLLPATLVAALLSVPVIGAAGPADVPAPRPTSSAALGPVDSASLRTRFAATHADIEAAERTAEKHGDGERASALKAMAAADRHFLTFDGRDGGRTAEVFGDLARAERIAVVVPGADVTVDNYSRLRNASRSLRRQLPAGSAVIAWLGYRPPSTISLATLNSERGSDAGHALRTFVAELTDALPQARTTLVCHSYGTVVCAHAASRSPVADIVLCGSPGTGYQDVGSLHTHATVWAGRGRDDWIADVPHLRLGLGVTEVGLGTDPLSPEFGARVFDAGDGGHSDYFAPGSLPLRNIARIVAGRAPSGTPSGGHHA
ncbi:alpha/beta hydrolase [Streptomyces sp. NPDC002763]|uniref:alpha/beta hydrolase n=1 Tax=Streptomyces sp. NPDC002763 TaxID=3154427 RepID=UPI00332AC8DF